MGVQPIPSAQPPLGRRRFLLAAGGLALVTACGGGGSPDPATSSDGSYDDLLLLLAGFADGNRAPSTLAAGTTIRAPYFLSGGGSGPAVNGLPSSVQGTLTDPSGATTDVELVRHDAGIPTPYFLLTHHDAIAGWHTLQATIGGETQEAQFLVAERSAVDLVQIGEPLRAVDTPTVADPRGYDPICTRFDPCPYHHHNLADIAANGRPTALLVATPGFCQTSICGPSVELLIELDVSADIDIVHAEVYLEPGQINDTGTYGEVGPVVSTYGMSFEPSFVVADADGLVVARLDFSFDRVEMADALALVS